jgi:hypothetical protein
MAGLRHDAKVCRENLKSERLRRELEIFTPAEIEEQAEIEKRRRQAAQKKAAQGSPLGLEEV